MSKVVYFLCDTEYGEVDAFFDEKAQLITWWSANDASWRGEYMSGLIAHFGGEVKSPGKALEAKCRKALHAEIKDY